MGSLRWCLTPIGAWRWRDCGEPAFLPSASSLLSRSARPSSAHHNRLDNPVLLRIYLFVLFRLLPRYFSDCPHLHPPLLLLFFCFYFGFRKAWSCDGCADAGARPRHLRPCSSCHP